MSVKRKILPKKKKKMIGYNGERRNIEGRVIKMTMLSFHLITGLIRRLSMGGVWELFSKYELDGNKTGFLKTGCAVS